MLFSATGHKRPEKSQNLGRGVDEAPALFVEGLPEAAGITRPDLRAYRLLSI
jgi:hypothetical protein